jgi:DNA-directed RNA polymerase subunit L
MIITEDATLLNLLISYITVTNMVDAPTYEAAATLALVALGF